MAEHSDYEGVDWTIRHPVLSTRHFALLQHRPSTRDSAGCVERNGSARARENAWRDLRHTLFRAAPHAALGGVADPLAAG